MRGRLRRCALLSEGHRRTETFPPGPEAGRGHDRPPERSARSDSITNAKLGWLLTNKLVVLVAYPATRTTGATGGCPPTRPPRPPHSPTRSEVARQWRAHR